jgi:hypothetical protein
MARAWHVAPALVAAPEGAAARRATNHVVVPVRAAVPSRAGSLHHPVAPVRGAVGLGENARAGIGSPVAAVAVPVHAALSAGAAHPAAADPPGARRRVRLLRPVDVRDGRVAQPAAVSGLLLAGGKACAPDEAGAGRDDAVAHGASGRVAACVLGAGQAVLAEGRPDGGACLARVRLDGVRAGILARIRPVPVVRQGKIGGGFILDLDRRLALLMPGIGRPPVGKVGSPPVDGTARTGKQEGGSPEESSGR